MEAALEALGTESDLGALVAEAAPVALGAEAALGDLVDMCFLFLNSFSATRPSDSGVVGSKDSNTNVLRRTITYMRYFIMLSEVTSSLQIFDRKS